MAVQQRVLSTRSFITVSGKGFRPERSISALARPTLILALAYLFVVVVLRDARLDRCGLPALPVHSERCQPRRFAALLLIGFHDIFDFSPHHLIDLEYDGGWH